MKRMTDVNIALHLLNQAEKDRHDEAFVVSQDSDLIRQSEWCEISFMEGDQGDRATYVAAQQGNRAACRQGEAGGN